MVFFPFLRRIHAKRYNDSSVAMRLKWRKFHAKTIKMTKKHRYFRWYKWFLCSSLAKLKNKHLCIIKYRTCQSTKDITIHFTNIQMAYVFHSNSSFRSIIYVYFMLSNGNSIIANLTQTNTEHYLTNPRKSMAQKHFHTDTQVFSK